MNLLYKKLIYIFYFLLEIGDWAQSPIKKLLNKLLKGVKYDKQLFK